MSGFAQAAQRNPRALDNISNAISGFIKQHQQNQANEELKRLYEQNASRANNYATQGFDNRDASFQKLPDIKQQPLNANPYHNPQIPIANINEDLMLPDVKINVNDKKDLVKKSQSDFMDSVLSSPNFDKFDRTQQGLMYQNLSNIADGIKYDVNYKDIQDKVNAGKDYNGKSQNFQDVITDLLDSGASQDQIKNVMSTSKPIETKGKWVDEDKDKNGVKQRNTKTGEIKYIRTNFNEKKPSETKPYDYSKALTSSESLLRAVNDIGGTRAVATEDIHSGGETIRAGEFYYIDQGGYPISENAYKAMKKDGKNKATKLSKEALIGYDIYKRAQKGEMLQEVAKVLQEVQRKKNLSIDQTMNYFTASNNAALEKDPDSRTKLELLRAYLTASEE